MKTRTLLNTLTFLTCFNLLSAAALYDIPVKTIEEEATTLAAYEGQVMLIVNVASKCGMTPQYSSLEALYQKHQQEGLVVLGFPCNQFGGQEPGTNADIMAFCSTTYGVSFPMFDKIEVNGANRHPLYTELAGEGSPFPGNIQWNFTKFLVGKDGTILARFGPGTRPDSPEIITAIETALKG